MNTKLIIKTAFLSTLLIISPAQSSDVINANCFAKIPAKEINIPCTVSFKSSFYKNVDKEINISVRGTIIEILFLPTKGFFLSGFGLSSAVPSTHYSDVLYGDCWKTPDNIPPQTIVCFKLF